MRTKASTAHPLQKLAQLGLLALAMGALGTLGANVAFAGDGGGCPGHKHHHPMSHADFQKRMDERMSALRAKLALTPEQEPAWNALREAGKQHMGFEEPDRAALAELSVPERVERKLARMDAHREHLAAKLEALKAFYAKLSPEQQATFDAEFMNWRGGREKGGPADSETSGADAQS